jgi:hypothetical protein
VFSQFSGRHLGFMTKLATSDSIDIIEMYYGKKVITKQKTQALNPAALSLVRRCSFTGAEE